VSWLLWVSGTQVVLYLEYLFNQHREGLLPAEERNELLGFVLDRSSISYSFQVAGSVKNIVTRQVGLPSSSLRLGFYGLVRLEVVRELSEEAEEREGKCLLQLQLELHPEPLAGFLSWRVGSFIGL